MTITGALAVLGVASTLFLKSDSTATFGNTTVDEFRYHSACGPIAGFVALRSLGCDVSLDDVVRGCTRHGSEAISLDDLRDYINGPRGVKCRGVWMTQKQLAKYATSGQHVPILVVRNGSGDANHVICVTAAAGDRVTIIDYPGLAREVKLSEIMARWDGQALLVSRDHLSDVLVHWHYFIPVFIAVLVVACRGVAGRAPIRKPLFCK